MVYYIVGTLYEQRAPNFFISLRLWRVLSLHACYFNYFKNKCRIHLNYWYILVYFYLLQKSIKVKNSLLRLKLFQKLKLNINNSAT